MLQFLVKSVVTFIKHVKAMSGSEYCATCTM